METEESAGPGRGFLLALGVVGILVGILVAAALVVPIQPKLVAKAPPVEQGVASVLMPPNAASVGFSPADITVIVGVNNTIQWTNQDSVAHTVYSSSVPAGAPPFHSGVLSNGDTFRVTLNVTGTYDYYCSIHPTTMKGTIVVKSSTTVIIPAGTTQNQLNFDPSTFTVIIGVNNTVTFVNQDSVPHTVTSLDGHSFNSQSIAPGKSWTFTFDTPGTFAFECTFHPSFMKGTVTVEASTG